ncbi:MAG: hypothetical protein WCO63_06850 [Bacteroidota bacterium]
MSGLKAQFYNGSQTDFGQNRVQYTQFQWTFFKYDNFDIYFYLNGKELALYTAQYAEGEITDIQRKLETSLDAKIQFVIFNTLSESKQSNLGASGGDASNSGNTGGMTRILDQKVILYFNGDHSDLQRQIRQGVTQVVLNQLLYGSSLSSRVKNSTLLFLPDWYLNGLLSYLSEDWNTTIDNRVRDGIISGRYRKFNQLTGTDATYAGHSFWRFIAEKYGPNVVPNIVYMAKISKSVESGFLYVLGVSFKSLVAEWLNYYQTEYTQENATALMPDDHLRALKPNSRQLYSQLRISSDGKYAAFATNESGRYRVMLENLNNKHVRKIIRRGYKLDEETDYSYPLIAWHPGGTLLAVVTEEKGKILLYFYTTGKGSLEKRFLYNFDKIVDFSYSPDGKSLLMSAVIKGQSDIFVYNIASNSFEQITKDIYDDVNPRFINKGKDIIFASNRLNDSLNPRNKLAGLTQLSSKKDLFIYHYIGRKPVLKQITNTPMVDERMPMEYEDNFITYLSDANGIYNRYLARFDSSISYIDTTTHYRYFTIAYPVTNSSRSILEHDIVPKAGLAGDLIYFGNRYSIFIDDLPKAKSLTASKPEPTFFTKTNNGAFKRANEDSVQEIKKLYQASHKHFVNVRQDEIDIPFDTLSSPRQTKIDINNYIFEKQAFIKLHGGDTLQTKTGQAGTSSLKPPNVPVGPKQLNYMVEYSLSQLVTQFDFFFLQYTYQPFTGGNSPIWLNPGLSVLFKVGATDLMEDYRIVGGIRPSLTFTNNEYLLNYGNFKHRLDREITFHRQVLENSIVSPISSQIKTSTYEVFYNLKYAFSQVRALKVTSLLRYDRTAYLSQEIVTLRKPNDMAYWASLKAEWIYDDTRKIGLNLLKGTRYKLFGEYFQEVSPKSKSLYVLGLDFRHYVKVNRSMIWATRFAASTSFGNAPLIYYLGGVDYWLAPSFNYAVPINQNQNYSYQTIATPLRGFNQNIRNGNSFALINTELRLPVFRYFINRPIKSDFINNFQIVGFGDIGTAWTGSNPYAKENSLYTKEIIKYPIKVIVDNNVEPIVAGYGFGLRSRILGYFLRADWAWGLEDGINRKSIFYLSMGLDF